MSVHYKDDGRKLTFKFQKFPEYKYIRVTATDPTTKEKVSHLRAPDEDRKKSKEDLRYIFFQKMFDGSKGKK